MNTHLVTVWISSTESFSERRISPHLLISQLKVKLEPITGIPAKSQVLALTNSSPDQSDSTQAIFLNDDSRTLSQYGVQEGSTIDVIDSDPTSVTKAGQYNDVSQVSKFELSSEEYASRRVKVFAFFSFGSLDTVRAFKERNKLGRFADEVTARQNKLENDDENLEESLKKRFPLNARCKVSSLTHDSASRGAIRFVGPVEFNKNHRIWIGVEIDEPNGKNDGAVSGVRYFTCQPSHGTFIQPERVEIGDFPIIDPFTDEE